MFKKKTLLSPIYLSLAAAIWGAMDVVRDDSATDSALYSLPDRIGRDGRNLLVQAYSRDVGEGKVGGIHLTLF